MGLQGLQQGRRKKVHKRIFNSGWVQLWIDCLGFQTSAQEWSVTEIVFPWIYIYILSKNDDEYIFDVDRCVYIYINMYTWVSLKMRESPKPIGFNIKVNHAPILQI